MSDDRSNNHLDPNLRKAEAILLGFFNIKRYPLRAEKREMAKVAGVSLHFVISFFYHTRTIAKKIEAATGNKQIYRHKRNSSEIEPIVNIFMSDKIDFGIRFFHFGNRNDLYVRLDPALVPNYKSNKQRNNSIGIEAEKNRRNI